MRNNQNNYRRNPGHNPRGKFYEFKRPDMRQVNYDDNPFVPKVTRAQAVHQPTRNQGIRNLTGRHYLR